MHIVHLSAVESLPDLREARKQGLPVTVETCPHYLFFELDQVHDGETEYKCAPPIRLGQQEKLWRALEAGDIDMIVSDHSPCPPEMKRRDTGDFMSAWGGIASLELGLSLVWTIASKRGTQLHRVPLWMATAPAKLAGFDSRKGAIAPGCDADIIGFDEKASWRVDPAALHQRHRLTPYAGYLLRGRIVPLKGRALP